MDRDNVDYALGVLVRYKEHSKPAVPGLARILNNIADSTNWSDINIRGLVTNALREIDPEAAVKR